MRRGRNLAVACAATLTAATLTAAPPTAEAQFKGQCKPGVGLRQVDPIVSRGATESAHLHEFFGNTALLNRPAPELADHADIVGAGTECDAPGESAAYWVPALELDGQPLRAFRMFTYYRAWNDAMTGEARPFPRDLRMLSDRFRWHCGAASSKPEPRDRIPFCGTATGKVFLTLSFAFPSCWDGQKNDHTTLGNTVDYAPGGVTNHLAFHLPRLNRCPDGFPIKLPRLRFVVGWGDGTAGFWRGTRPRLVSDAIGAPRGSSAHGDFWNTWRQPALKRFVADCINRYVGRATCGE